MRPTSTLWNLDAGFLASRPTDSEVLDRLRAARNLPEQADFRAWKADILAGYRSVESTRLGGTCRTGARFAWWSIRIPAGA